MLHTLFNCAVSEPDLPGLLLELKSIKAKYHRFGIQLGVPLYEIEAWEKSQSDADIMLEKILQFLFANDHNPMETLYTALVNIDQSILVKKLKLKYGGAQGNNAESFISIDILCTNGKKKYWK